MITQTRKLFAALLVILFLQSCSPGTQQNTMEATETQTSLVSPSLSATSDSTLVSSTEIVPIIASSPAPASTAATDNSTLEPNFWMELPIVPDGISERVREIYARGQSMGNNPNAFSKVGDCNSTVPYFLADYDLGPGKYNLGEYDSLQPTIEYYSGSYGRRSLSAKIGLSTAGVLASLWSDWKQCASNETPLDCEYRIQRPSFAIISLGTNEAYDVKLDRTPFEGRLRRVIEHSIDQGVVPILSTKADNDEGDHYINSVTARLALEYELPLWNYWKAVQPLPQHGMRSSDHLTFAPINSFADFSKPEYLNYGMQMRNLTALQLLDMIRREITGMQVSADGAPTVEAETATPVAHEAGETMVSLVDGMTLAYIPAGTFAMGSDSGNPDEAPIHTISLDGYWMDTTEVTNTMFATFLNATGNQTEGGVPWLDGLDPYVLISNKQGDWQPARGYEAEPIVGVSWYGANAYCTWAGRSLPSEAQWEYAAKGITRFRFPWGNDGLDCDHSRYSGCGNRPIQTGSLTLGASPFGIYEMAGNVAEWVNDRYAPNYYQQSPSSNPTGPINGYYRVYRGGYWGSAYIALQTTHRDWAGADTQENFIGFRCGINP
jgi:formylglycine-generating enzyme required for sulfatase activity